MKILIIKPSSLGDVIHALPVLRLLRQAHPKAEIYWWIRQDFKGLVENDPDLNGFFEFPRHGWGKAMTWQQFFLTALRARAMRFDWVIDLQGLARSGALAWLARGKFTIGVDDRREFASGFYDRAVPRPGYHTHAVDWYLEVTRELGAPVHDRFTWLHPNTKAMESVQARWKPGTDPWVVFVPGARWLNKRWPAESYAQLARMLSAKKPNLRFVVLGARDERLLGEHITAAVPGKALNLAGETSFAELMEWVRLGELMVTNDTGPMHIRAAFRKPQVALFGPTEPRRTGPYGQLDSVMQHSGLACVPCMRATCRHPEPIACLKQIAPARVFERCLALGLQSR